MATKTSATLEDLYRVPEHGKAELVNGELVRMSPTGGIPGYAAAEIFVSLRAYARRTRTDHWRAPLYLRLKSAARRTTVQPLIGAPPPASRRLHIVMTYTFVAQLTRARTCAMSLERPAGSAGR